MSGVPPDANPSQPHDELPEGGEETLPSEPGEQSEPIALADETGVQTGVAPAPAARWDKGSEEVAGIEDGEDDRVHSAGDPGTGSHGDHTHPADEHDGELGDAAAAAVAAGPKRPSKGTSRLGLLALFVGIAACVLCRPSMLPPRLQFSPTTPALAGLALAFLAMAGILFGSRARSGVPLLAVLLCLSAIGVSAYEGGARDVNTTRYWANGQIEKYRTVLDRVKTRIAPASPPTSAQPANPVASQSVPALVSPPQAVPGVIGQTGTPAIPRPPVAPVDPDAGIGAGTIFDMRPGSPGSSSGVTGPPQPSPEPGAPPVASPPVRAPDPSLPVTGTRPGPGALITPRVLSAQSALRAAQGKVKAAEDGFRYSFAKSNNPEYLAAQAEVDAADKLVEDAKRRSDGFGQPLIDATLQRKEAQEKVARIVNDAMARDATVAASRGELVAAEESLRQASTAAGLGK